MTGMLLDVRGPLKAALTGLATLGRWSVGTEAPSIEPRIARLLVAYGLAEWSTDKRAELTVTLRGREAVRRRWR